MYQPTNVSHPGPDKEKTVMSMREGIDYISYIYIYIIYIYIYNIFLMVGLCVFPLPSNDLQIIPNALCKYKCLFLFCSSLSFLRHVLPIPLDQLRSDGINFGQRSRHRRWRPRTTLGKQQLTLDTRV